MAKAPKTYPIASLIRAVYPLVVVLIEDGQGISAEKANVTEYYNTLTLPKAVGFNGHLSYASLTVDPSGFDESLAQMAARCKVTLLA